ncbi:MAG: DUF4328 domain-containing protein [Pseudomonadota bacterium]
MHTEELDQGTQTLVSRAKFAEYSIYAVVPFFVAVMIGEALEIVGVIDLRAFELDLLAELYSLVLIGTLPFYIFSVITIAMWIHRAHKNLHDQGVEGLEYTPGWGVGWYFIPIANLFKPFQAMKELWGASHRYKGNFGDPAEGNLGLWWGLWIFGGILSNISTRMSMSDDPGIYDSGIILSFISSGLNLGAAYLIWQIIRQITAAQVSRISLSEVFE